MARNVNADYYGYRDEDDGIILPLEEEAEKQGNLPMMNCQYYRVFLAIIESVRRWEEFKAQGKVPEVEEEEDIYETGQDIDVGYDDEGGMDIEWEEGEDSHTSSISVPSQKEVEEMLIRRRKKVNYV